MTNALRASVPSTRLEADTPLFNDCFWPMTSGLGRSLSDHSND